MAQAFKLPEGATEVESAPAKDDIMSRLPGGPTAAAFERQSEALANLNEQGGSPYVTGVANEFLGGGGQVLSNLPGAVAELPGAMAEMLVPPGVRTGGGLPTAPSPIAEVIKGGGRMVNAFITPIQEKVGGFVKDLAKKAGFGDRVSNVSGAVADIGTGIALSGPGALVGAKAVSRISSHIPRYENLSRYTKSVIDDMRLTTGIAEEGLTKLQGGSRFKNVTYPATRKAVAETRDELYNLARQSIPQDAPFMPTALHRIGEELKTSAASAKGIASTKAERIGGQIERSKERTAAAAKVREIDPYASSDAINKFMDENGIGLIDRQWTFGGLDNLLRKVREEHGIAAKAGRDNTARQFEKLETGIMSSMKEGAEQLGNPEAIKLFDKADKFNRAQYAPYFSRTEGKVSPARAARQQRPEDIVDYVIKADNVSEVRNIKRMLVNEPSKWRKEFVEPWFNSLVKDATDVHGNGVDPVKFSKAIQSYSPDMLDALVGPRVARGELRELTKTIAELTAKDPSVFASHSSIPGMSWGAVRVGASILGGAPAQAIKPGLVMLSSVGLAKLLNSPRGVKMLNDGFKLTPGSRRSTILGAEIMNLVNSGERVKEPSERPTE